MAEITGRDDPKTNILQLVHQWLCDARNGRWLMVLDNADDDGHVIVVQPMNEEESLALLRARIPAAYTGGSKDDEKAPVQALEYIPLAITQAGSYIAYRSSLITVPA